MTGHLGYDKNDPVGRGSGNSRNGTRAKTVLTEIGPVQIEVPRETNSSFEPQIVKKRQRQLTRKVEIVYCPTVSKDTVSRFTDKVLAEMAEWCNRPLESVYPVVFVDAIVRHEAPCNRVEVRPSRSGRRSGVTKLGTVRAGGRREGGKQSRQSRACDEDLVGAFGLLDHRVLLVAPLLADIGPAGLVVITTPRSAPAASSCLRRLWVGSGEGIDIRPWSPVARPARSLVLFAHAFLVVTTAAQRRIDHPPDTLIPLTVNEFRRLFISLLLHPLHAVADILAWSTWRRRHQARARACHYRKQDQQQ